MTRYPSEPRVSEEDIATARVQANQAAERASVVITELVTPDQSAAAAEILNAIWNREGEGVAPMKSSLLVALNHAGNYTFGAYRGQQLIGVTAGFFGPPNQSMLHSHIAGVSPAVASRGIGAAMKLHQRLWCLERGVATMQWTFDPLIRRNASFNLNKLGARLEGYLPQFYGDMSDATNVGQGSDRALVRWHLTQDSDPAEEITEDGHLVHLCLKADNDGAPVFSPAPKEGVVGLRIPSDVEALRVTHPTVSKQWRTALRETMHPLLEAGWSVSGIQRNGTYVLRR